MYSTLPPRLITALKSKPHSKTYPRLRCISPVTQPREFISSGFIAPIPPGWHNQEAQSVKRSVSVPFLRMIGPLRGQCGFNTKQIVKNYETAQTALDALEKHYKLDVSGFYHELCRKFDVLDIDSCTEAADHGAHLNKIWE
ncbi:hypothetical protein K470DRAFT_265864 [Piedraia hortae CBS 480.64]|uniref:Uncharacterized protein n=1 Tax=Piedraia hortae CBS 480.64 TaxID=1314780 RepID=A0A6A7BVH8_9PEZI|nr:hypothetical protein K470DRAFT_265864 [Piedraia hortae CBS 480.64]